MRSPFLVANLSSASSLSENFGRRGKSGSLPADPQRHLLRLELWNRGTAWYGASGSSRSWRPGIRGVHENGAPGTVPEVGTIITWLVVWNLCYFPQ